MVIVERLVFYNFMLNDRNGILHHMEGHKSPTITGLLWEEGMKVICVGILNFLAKFNKLVQFDEG